MRAAGAALLAVLLSTAAAPGARAAGCAEPPLTAPLCETALQSRGDETAARLRRESCRLAMQSYIFALDRWALCVRNEAELRKLEARRRLDCLAHDGFNCS